MYRSAASVGTARIAPDIIVTIPSRALRVLRIVLSVRFSRPVCGSRSPQIERARTRQGGYAATCGINKVAQCLLQLGGAAGRDGAHTAQARWRRRWQSSNGRHLTAVLANGLL